MLPVIIYVISTWKGSGEPFELLQLGLHVLYAAVLFKSLLAVIVTDDRRVQVVFTHRD